MSESESAVTANGPETNPQSDPANSPADPDDPATLRKERDQLYEQLQRTMADFVNYQRRSKTQADLDRQYATQALAIDLLDVLDNFERALEAARSAGEAGQAIASGLDMVHKQFLHALAKHGVTTIEALDTPFDPTRHEALFQQPAPDRPEGTVIQELAKGYMHHDRVLRPAKVAVSTKPQ